MIAGVDGCADGWVVVCEREGGDVGVEVVPEFDGVLDRDLDHVVIDIPIGLPGKGRRRCDEMARKRVGRLHSSVFSTPIRGILHARSYPEMRSLWSQIETDRRGSKQQFSILEKIHRVDTRMTPERQEVVREGHPEVSFAAANDGPLRHFKGTAAGVMERVELLSPYFPGMKRQILRVRRSKNSGDVLDAFALLWSARRLRDGRANVIPKDPEIDERGLKMEMVY